MTGRDGNHRCKKCRQKLSDKKRYWLTERDRRIKQATLWNKNNTIVRKKINSKNYKKTYSTEEGKERLLNRFRVRYWLDPEYYRKKAIAQAHGVTPDFITELRKRQPVCQLCGTSNDLTVDHMNPVSNGGKAIEGNVQSLCGPCNSWKSNKLFLANGSGYIVGYK